MSSLRRQCWSLTSWSLTSTTPTTPSTCRSPTDPRSATTPPSSTTSSATTTTAPWWTGRRSSPREPHYRQHLHLWSWCLLSCLRAAMFLCQAQLWAHPGCGARGRQSDWRAGRGSEGDVRWREEAGDGAASPRPRREGRWGATTSAGQQNWRMKMHRQYSFNKMVFSHQPLGFPAALCWSLTSSCWASRRASHQVTCLCGSRTPRRTCLRPWTWTRTWRFPCRRSVSAVAVSRCWFFFPHHSTSVCWQY